MKIQTLSHGKDLPGWGGRWIHLQREFKKLGHEVDNIMRYDWKKLYIKYLKFKPDVLLSQGIIGFVPPILKKLRLMNVPIAHDWNDDHTMVMGEKYGPDRIAFLEYNTIKNHEHVVTCSKFLQRKAAAMGKEITYIPHGVDPWFKTKEKYEFEGEGLKVVYIGTMIGWTMADKLIQAVDGLDCQLYLIGDFTKEQEKNSPKNAHFIKRVPHREVPKFVNGADICALVSDDDSSLKMYEYLYLGKPIIAFQGRVGFVLNHRENVFLTQDFRKGLKTLIEDEDLRKKIAKGAKKFKVYTWRQIARKYINYLERIVE